MHRRDPGSAYLFFGRREGSLSGVLSHLACPVALLDTLCRRSYYSFRWSVLTQITGLRAFCLHSAITAWGSGVFLPHGDGFRTSTTWARAPGRLRRLIWLLFPQGHKHTLYCILYYVGFLAYQGYPFV